MGNNNALIMGIASLLALALSLPLEWMTIHNAHMQLSGGMQGFGQHMGSSMGTMTLQVTGINGSITFLAKVPIWLIVGLGMVGSGLALLNALGAASLPKLVPLIPLVLAAFYTGIAIAVAIASAEASLGIGAFIALLGLVLGTVLTFSHRPRFEKQPA